MILCAQNVCVFMHEVKNMPNDCAGKNHHAQIRAYFVHDAENVLNGWA